MTSHFSDPAREPQAPLQDAKLLSQCEKDEEWFKNNSDRQLLARLITTEERRPFRTTGRGLPPNYWLAVVIVRRGQVYHKQAVAVPSEAIARLASMDDRQILATVGDRDRDFLQAVLLGLLDRRHRET